jgi:hypothetical protein
MMYTVSARRGARVEHWSQFPNLRDALRQLDGFVYAFPELISELRGASGVLWRCQPAKAQASPHPSEAA